MNPLSLAYLCADRGVPVGGTKGASAHVRGVTEALCRRGHRVRIAAARTLPEADALSAEVHPIQFDRTLKNLREAIAEHGGDAQMAREVHGLMLNESVTRTLEEMHATEPIEAIYERCSLWSWAGQRFARAAGIPWVLEINAPLVEEQKKYRGIELEPVAAGIEGHLWSRADAIVVPSTELRDAVYRKVGERSGVAVLPNAVDFELFDQAAGSPSEEPVLADRFVIAFSGSLKPWHGVDRLLRAFERVRRPVPNAHLLILGNGPMAGAVEHAVKKLGTDCVTWTGAVAHEEVPRWLMRADVGVAPYPDLDSFYFSPLKIVEYLAAGLPVVASRIGQIPDLVQQDETGLLVPPGEVRPLVDALVHLARNPKIRERMGRRARVRAERRHDWSTVAEKIEPLLGRRRRAAEARAGSEEHAT